jgi:primosomal protein N' (replication factor Y)
VPAELQASIAPGHLVTAPFGKRKVQGVVISLPEHAEVPETKPIDGLVDPDPVLNAAQLELGRWIGEQTASPYIDCLTIMLPPGLSQQADSLYTLRAVEPNDLSETERRIIKLLDRRGALRGRQIERSLSRLNWRPAADRLIRRGVITRKSILDPPKVSIRRIRTARLAVPPDRARESFDDLGIPGKAASGRRRAILQTLIQEREAVEVTWVYAETGGNSNDLRYLHERGLIALGGNQVWRDPLADMDFVPTSPPILTSDQQQVWTEIDKAMDAGEPSAFLLHGVTGSGKTEIYLNAVEKTISRGEHAIVLVPEIALTPQTIRRFLSRFPGQVGVIHSQLSRGERYDTWRRARAGELPLMIGPRSALFAPLSNIKLIVVDESHDDSYKEQSRAPRFHARETAQEYARILRGTCILGSATPDLVTRHRAESNKPRLLSLPQRIMAHQERLKQQASRLGVTPLYRHESAAAEFMDLPAVRVVDMRAELRAGNRSLFSRALQEALSTVLQAGEQAILFLNRRGSASYVFCRDCGESMHCSRCDSPLTFHRADERLQCHHCAHTKALPQKCPNCESSNIRQFGAGTQRIQSDLEDMFPSVKTLRWDRDTTRTKGAHDIILSHFAAQRADVLIGTQMVAKGLDLPLVTLVGVVLADIGLSLPDYRAPEKTFQVLTQVAGRAGRSLLGGKVVLQTYQPDHYAVRAAAKHDYSSFYDTELKQRRDLIYPPFIRLAKLVYSNVSEDRAQEEAGRLGQELQHQLSLAQDAQASLIGPVPAFYRKLRGDHRWQIILRASDPRRYIPETLPKGWIVDVDPVSLL